MTQVYNVMLSGIAYVSCLFKALMALFVLASKDGWVSIMYNGLDAVGIDQQVRAFILSILPTMPCISAMYTQRVQYQMGSLKKCKTSPGPPLSLSLSLSISLYNLRIIIP